MQVHTCMRVHTQQDMGTSSVCDFAVHTNGISKFGHAFVDDGKQPTGANS